MAGNDIGKCKTVIFDIDGTLADIWYRRKFLDQETLGCIWCRIRIQKMFEVNMT